MTMSGMNNSNTTSNMVPHPCLTVIYSIIIVLGLVFNAGALWVFSCHIRLRSGTTIYMRSLATADLLLVCFLPFQIASSYHPELRDICKLSFLIFLINMYTSIFFLACISLDRCIATLFPLRLPMRQLQRAAPWVSALVWIFSISASLPPYLIWKLKSLRINSTDTDCLQLEAVTKKTTVAVTFSLGFALPFCLLLVSSLVALWVLRKGKNNGSQLQKMPKAQGMILANLLIFTFCFLPYHTLLCFYQRLLTHSSELALQLFQASQLLASSNAVLDPILYYFTTEAFRETRPISAVRSVAACGCWRVAEAPEGDNRKRPSETVTFLSVTKVV
ncbi:lysophosphatidic acid receptor 4-like isoform X1 [Hemitrygon akajei]|uniref:lysophosphatidic acid receptor 4-like isoform X1 n=2 Tax=Hemitrygon akajei TaxID=2704970 RepID=UPI003BF99BC5